MRISNCFTKVNLILLSSFFAVISCKKEHTLPALSQEQSIRASTGFYVINEGGFNKSNGSISYINLDNNKIYNNVYANANNGAALGDVIQSASLVDSNLFIACNNSNALIKANAFSFKRDAAVSPANSPRFSVASNGKLFVSEWNGNSVGVYEQGRLTRSAKIATGIGPEALLVLNNTLYCTNSGGFGIDSTLTIINAANNVIIKTIGVSDGPTALCEQNGYLYVLCRGDYGLDFGSFSDDTEPYMNVIRLSDNQLVKQVKLGSKGDHFTKMAIDSLRNRILILANDVLIFNTITNALSSQKFANGFYYGIGINPKNSDVMLADAGNYVGAGKVKHYTANGSLKATYSVGVIPNGFVFKP